MIELALLAVWLLLGWVGAVWLVRYDNDEQPGMFHVGLVLGGPVALFATAAIIAIEGGAFDRPVPPRLFLAKPK